MSGAGRRRVRVTAGFFDQLDSQLGADRGPHGEPSATDFVVLDLPVIVDRFAEGFDGLPEIELGVGAARVLIASGVLVASVAVYGILSDDDVIDLVGASIDA